MEQAAFVLIREPVVRVAQGENYTPGKLYYNGLYSCFTCEDEDRFLENGVTEKIDGRTAIPRGRYKLENSWSPKFGKRLPAVMGVSHFVGIRIHGANDAGDVLGCIGVGKVRTRDGIAKCADTVQRIIDIIDRREDEGKSTWLEVK